MINADFSTAPAQPLPPRLGADEPPNRVTLPIPTLRCLVVGAGEAGRAIARDLCRTPEFGLRPIGFVDDAKTKGALGLPVLGTATDLSAVVDKFGVDVVVIAIPSLPPSSIHCLAEAAKASGASIRYLPSFLTALEREAHLSDLHHLDLNRLLARQELRVVRATSRPMIENKRVLVTGAGGSIGSELCRQIKAFGPANLFLLDHDESNLHRLQLQMTGQGLLDSDEIIIADIRDRDRVHQVFADCRPEVVFHAAAHKHLPLLELHPCEGVKSNVLGTKYLVEAALDAGAERFVLISTDKAADPTSILGATKRIAEMLLPAYSGMGTKLASVRFGNVLGSRGSLLSVLSEQIQRGGEVTVTHPDVTRFFMTVEEAAGLVIEAGSMADAGETFVLDMGEPVRIVDLVRNYAAAFHIADIDVRIRYTGLRPGEKLNERLFSECEEAMPTVHPQIYATQPRSAPSGFAFRLDRLSRAAMNNQAHQVRRVLADLLPEYQPTKVESFASNDLYPDGF